MIGTATSTKLIYIVNVVQNISTNIFIFAKMLMVCMKDLEMFLLLKYVNLTLKYVKLSLNLCMKENLNFYV